MTTQERRSHQRFHQVCRVREDAPRVLLRLLRLCVRRACTCTARQACKACELKFSIVIIAITVTIGCERAISSLTMGVLTGRPAAPLVLTVLRGRLVIIVIIVSIGSIGCV